MRRGLAALILLALPHLAAAQSDVCRPGKASNEARTMAKFAVPLAFGSGVAPAVHPAWRVQLGIEVSYLPEVDDATATPTFCRPDKTHPENTDLLFAAPRPRVWLSLPHGFVLEGSWTPPLEMGDVKANLFGVAIARTVMVAGHGMVLDLRAHATVGKIEAPITCNDEALTIADSPCYQGTRSNDSFRPNVMGGSLAVSWSSSGTFRPYLGVGFNHLAPRFQVNFTNQFGGTDRRKVEVDLNRLVLFAGATWTFSRLEVGGEIYSAPTDAVTGRLIGRFRLRD